MMGTMFYVSMFFIIGMKLNNELLTNYGCMLLCKYENDWLV